MTLLELKTGCRIHFGLMELMQGAAKQFAGLGVMLDQPELRIRLRVDPHDSQRAVPMASIRMAGGLQLSDACLREYTQRIDQWSRSKREAQAESRPIEVELSQAYPFHSGMGAGTQLACLLALVDLIDSTQVLADEWQNVSSLLPYLNTAGLARISGRGLRSSVGVHGFLNGNLVLDSGIARPQAIAKMEPQLEAHAGADRTLSYKIPETWKFVIVRAADSSNITGRREHEMMQEISQRPSENSHRMWQLALSACRAAEQSDFSAFTEDLEEYLDHAAGLFSTVQGGKYNGWQCQEVVEAARAAGLRAVGQSSWGPTIFGMATNTHAANEAAQLIRSHHSNWTVQIASVARNGAQVRRFRPAQS